jgi:hypothetical protein
MAQRTTSKEAETREVRTTLEEQISTILARSTPPEERGNLEHFLRSVMLFIKETRGEELTEQEKSYPPHPDFAPVMMLLRRPELVAGIQRRLDVIYRYSVTDAQRIMNLITAASYPSRAALSLREVRLLLELHQDPSLHQNELARRLSTTPRTIAKELSYLRRDFSLRVTRTFDPHKFQLASYQTVFRTKSLRSSERLDQVLRIRRPLLLRRLAFDIGLRRGYLLYLVPDQPKPRRMLQERIRELADEYFEEHKVTRWRGLYLSISFDAYDTSKGQWAMEADAVFENLQRLGEGKYDMIRAPRGIDYGSAIRFDRVDYLLAESQLPGAEPKDLELKRDLLKQAGFGLSLKTIWAREQRLRKSSALYTSIYYDIPQFEELVMLSIDCTAEACEVIRLFPCMLPFTYISPTDSGITLVMQRPTLYSALTGELVRVISRVPGVSDVQAIGLEESFTTSAASRIASRWDEGHQRWVLEEGDL